MEVYYFKDPKLNFGDDLNEFIWKQVLPQSILSCQDLVLVGIGSILTSERLDRFVGGSKKVAVLGTGVSYGTLPRDMSQWCIAAVRGPLTAAVVGRPELAVTDGAILLAETKGLFEKVENPDQIIFMPHRSTLEQTSWKPVAESLGMRFVSPQTDTMEVFRAFSKAKLVITEAMHGAIVADTMRIPWIPVTVHPHTDEFKWRDWTQSMELPYEPIALPALTLHDRIFYRALNKNLARMGINSNRMLVPPQSADVYEAYLKKRFSLSYEEMRKITPFLSTSQRLARSYKRLWDPIIYRLGTRSLAKASRTRTFLSSDAVFADRLSRMKDAIRTIETYAAR